MQVTLAVAVCRPQPGAPGVVAPYPPRPGVVGRVAGSCRTVEAGAVARIPWPALPAVDADVADYRNVTGESDSVLSYRLGHTMSTIRAKDWSSGLKVCALVTSVRNHSKSPCNHLLTERPRGLTPRPNALNAPGVAPGGVSAHVPSAQAPQAHPARSNLRSRGNARPGKSGNGENTDSQVGRPVEAMPAGQDMITGRLRRAPLPTWSESALVPLRGRQWGSFVFGAPQVAAGVGRLLRRGGETVARQRGLIIPDHPVDAVSCAGHTVSGLYHVIHSPPVWARTLFTVQSLAVTEPPDRPSCHPPGPRPCEDALPPTCPSTTCAAVSPRPTARRTTTPPAAVTPPHAETETTPMPETTRPPRPERHSRETPGRAEYNRVRGEHGPPWHLLTDADREPWRVQAEAWGDQ